MENSEILECVNEPFINIFLALLFWWSFPLVPCFVDILADITNSCRNLGSQGLQDFYELLLHHIVLVYLYTRIIHHVHHHLSHSLALAHAESLATYSANASTLLIYRERRVDSGEIADS